MKNFKVGILGATGAVGQKFIRLLQNHPWFTVKALGASVRSLGKPYKKAVHWIEPVDIPGEISKMNVSGCEPDSFRGIDFVFSGLDSSVAGEVEKKFAKAGIPVISNAKNYRMNKSVPLLIPEMNPGHAALIETQTFTDDNSGWIVANPNCVCVPLAMSLQPFNDAFGIKSVMVTSMQAVSGAGYPGISSMDILGNIVPFIGGEEEKIALEPLKILGSLEDKGIAPADFTVQAVAVRVPAIEGHLLSISVQPMLSLHSIKDAIHAIRTWKNPIESLDLPSAPKKPIKLYDNERFPQPRLHAGSEKGMQVGMGRLRKGRLFDINYTALAHNTIRGAAGGAVLNAELLVKKGYLT